MLHFCDKDPPEKMQPTHAARAVVFAAAICQSGNHKGKQSSMDGFTDAASHISLPH